MKRIWFQNLDCSQDVRWLLHKITKSSWKAHITKPDPYRNLYKMKREGQEKTPSDHCMRRTTQVITNGNAGRNAGRPITTYVTT